MKIISLFFSVFFLLLFSDSVNSQVWETLSSGLNGPVYVMENYNDNIIAGGDFTLAGGVSAHYIARWDGAGWYPLPGNFAPSSIVRALRFDGNILIAGGDFGL